MPLGLEEHQGALLGELEGGIRPSRLPTLSVGACNLLCSTAGLGGVRKQRTGT